ncbi:GNAT family N-acetyltransferase [Streptomyces macrosporus]|uniref:N-acetyltransferase domain-containing protein n=1 Tax=Streptomyces macrosporus TaxID=44032 RepID=A0ABN3KTI1_9ACTN
MDLDLVPVTGPLTGPTLADLTAVYASNPGYHRLSGDFPDPEHVTPDQVASALGEELENPDAEVLLLRDRARRPAGVACLLHRHPDPGDPYPWIGLLMIHGDHHGRGLGRAAAGLVEERLRTAGRAGVRLAVLENNPTAWAFWTALGYREIDRRRDRAGDRPCSVLHKDLR